MSKYSIEDIKAAHAADCWFSIRKNLNMQCYIREYSYGGWYAYGDYTGINDIVKTELMVCLIDDEDNLITRNVDRLTIGKECPPVFRGDK